MNPTPKQSVRVRLAPSPTGSFHIGTARTGLFNWLFARQKGGKFLLRIEDTDQERSEKEYEEIIYESLKWLGLDWDEEVCRQSERKEIYEKYVNQLLAAKRAYFCFCTKEELEAQRQNMIAAGLPPKYSGHCRELEKPPINKEAKVIRFKTPEAKVVFKDLIRGEVKFDSSLFGDFVIAKDSRNVLYNLAVVIDDALAEISHVIRGEDHISNTPKQILIQKAFGLQTPTYAHIPLILAPDRSKLSKRKGETSLLKYREMGYLPEAMINFMVLLGWHPSGDEEVFNLERLLEVFDLKRVQKSGAVFNKEKLDWINSQYIKTMPLKKLLELIQPILETEGISAPPGFVEKILGVARERMKTLGDFLPVAGFFFVLPNYETKLLRWGDEILPEVKMELSRVLETMEQNQVGDFTEERLKELMADFLKLENRGLVFWPFRVALSGQSVSPDPLVIASILGKEEVVRRVKLAIQKLEAV